MIKARHSAIKFFGIGSATAAPLLYSYVKSHPGISLPNSDPAYFSDVNKSIEGLAWYESQWPSTKEGVLRGELSLGYLGHAPAAGLISRTYPTAKIFAVIENPLVSVKVEYVEAKRAGRIDAKQSFADFVFNNPDVLQRACYGRQLVPYFGYYSTTDLLIFTASEVRKDPLRTLAAVFTHIGVDPKYVPLALRHLVVEEEDDAKRPGLIKRSYRAINKQIKHLYVALSRIFKPPVVETETAAVAAFALSIPEDLENKLKNYFIKDVKILEDLLRRPLRADWGFDLD
jgi:hypothetical protein